ncbi:hypothetical protein ATE67_00750 [Sphingopyxis sp. H050]|nr:hypothetical protein ATE67_00750 [Sphingopyxis sp. H050]
MGDAEGMDERIFETLDLVRNYGDEKWWLYASTCRACGQNWMVAQEERIHDNYCLKRIDQDTLSAIVEHSRWPPDFLSYELILRLGREAGHVATFLDSRSPVLVETAHDLRQARPEISIEDIAYALAIPTKQAKRLLKV